MTRKEKAHAGYSGQFFFFFLFSDGTVDDIYAMDTMILCFFALLLWIHLLIT